MSRRLGTFLHIKKKCSYSEKATSQHPRVPPSPRWPLWGSIRKPAHEGWTLENLAPVVCLSLGCFCSLTGDDICKVNCGWEGGLHGCTTWAVIEGPIFVECPPVAVLKFLTIFLNKRPHILTLQLVLKIKLWFLSGCTYIPEAPPCRRRSMSFEVDS